MTIQQDYTLKPRVVKEFTATGIIGPGVLQTSMMGNLRVVVENVGANTILVQGRLTGQSAWITLETVVGATSGTTVDISLVDEIRFNCTVYAASGGTPKLVASSFFDVASGGGGGGAVNDAANVGVGGVGLFDSLVGDTLNFRNINSNTLTVALDGANSEVDVDFIGTANAFAGFDSSGDAYSIPGWTIDTTSGGSLVGLTEEPNANAASYDVHRDNINIDPIANSPAETWNIKQVQVAIDTQNDGFSFGTGGQAVRLHISNVSHQGQSDIGSIEFIQNNFNIGNGTDPIDVKGIGYAFGFGNINANVTVNGPMQGYGYQPNVDAAATLDPATSYTNAFYDAANIDCASPGHTSYSASPSIASINNNNNYTGFTCGANIPTFTGNAGFTAFNASPTLGTFNSGGYFQGVNVNPTITSARYAAGLNVSMDNVTPYAGVKAAVTIQDLTFEFIAAGSFNNSYTMEFTPGATAGSEVVSISGQTIEVQIEVGVSTATQVKTACDANGTFASNITTTISGTASDPQVAEGPTNFAGGIDAGQVLAAYLDGDVQITGGLSFSGALSIGKLSAFASEALIDGGGTPTSIHSLITNPTVAANATLTSADTISVNTAALINIGDNATVGTSFIGVAALGLPAVLTMGTGSTLDRVYGALFALSLDASAGGGTADEVGLCKALAIPNGVTTVNKLYGYLFDLPFGDPGTTTYGFYDRPGKNNYFAGTVMIGGTAGSDDTVANSSVGLELKSTTKAMLLSRMDTTERNALTAVAGMVIFNTTTSAMEYYDGSAWV